MSFEFPALRDLGELATREPIVVVDSREQDPLVFTHLQSVKGTIYSGDYSIQGLEDLFSVERKSISDLVGCCMGENRSRFERELLRLRGYRFRRLLIVGSRGEIEMQRYRSRISPKAVLATLGAFEIRYDLPAVFCPTPAEAAVQVERWVFYFAREFVLAANNLLRATTYQEIDRIRHREVQNVESR